LAELANWLTLG